MRRLVRDDVVREATEYRAGGAREVPEKQRLVGLGIERVRVRERMGGDLQLVAGEAPADSATECAFEAREHRHDDRVDVLLVEIRVAEKSSRVGDSGISVALESVDPRLVEEISGRVIVNHLDPIPPWAGGK